jgi:hypothetical protein
MPAIADFTNISNMGVLLLSCITKNATTKARTTFCSSPLPLGLSPVADVASAVENVSAAYSDTTAAPHEYFDQTTLGWVTVIPTATVIWPGRAHGEDSGGAMEPGLALGMLGRFSEYRVSYQPSALAVAVRDVP